MSAASATLALAWGAAHGGQGVAQVELRPVIAAIASLESARDPKCYATASRLEDFMYGTPLADAARREKVRLQKALILRVWQDAAARRAGGEGAGIDLDALARATGRYLSLREAAGSDPILALPGDRRIGLRYDDLRQYGTVAYALRAILAVQQDQLLGVAPRLPPLDDLAVQHLKKTVDAVTLAALKAADRGARLTGEGQVSPERLRTAWIELLGHVPAPDPLVGPAAPSPPAGLPVLRQVIRQKLASFEAYNQVSSAVFLRNLQVYFARHRWPTDPAADRAAKAVFTEAMIAFTTDLYRGAAGRARARGAASIQHEDVAEFAQAFVPHRMNEFEDATFFPRLAPADQVTLEAYDMDAFRDGGLHWRYLEAALDEAGLETEPEPDPFAAELLVENVAQYGVLVLRLAGEIAKERGERTLLAEHFPPALRTIQDRIDRHARAPAEGPGAGALASSSVAALRPTTGAAFREATAESGIRHVHASSDWLARFLRSYAVRGGDTAVLAVPQAFGGAGAAAEDLDGDGDPDLLLLSGTGNRLFANRGDGRFEDVTEASGLAWVRPEDGRPGEPRQPILADFDDDGRPDVFISYAVDDHRIYKNLGGLRFEDRTAVARLGGKGLVGGPATAADFDGDGRLDLYIGYFGQYIEGVKPTLARRNQNGLPNRLFLNRGDFTFEDATAGSGCDDRGWAQALAHTDFDRDGRQDLLVGNDFGINVWLRNLGGSRFEDVAPAYGTDKPSYTMGIGIGDLDADLHPDVYISNIVTMDKDQKYVLPSDQTPGAWDARKLAKMRVVEANDLFVSRVEGGKLVGYERSQAVGRGYEATGWAWGCGFLDFDHDGDEDLYVANGMNDYAVYSAENPYYTDPSGKPRDVRFADAGRDSNILFENRQGRLENMGEAGGAGLLANSRAVVFADLDGDGDLDMVVNNYHGPAVVYRNEVGSRAGRWLSVRLVGDPAKGGNRDAIGARLLVDLPDGRRLWREVHGSEGYLTMHPKEKHFGLGDAASVDLTVEWPGGATTVHRGLAAGRRYRIDQATGKVQVVPGR